MRRKRDDETLWQQMCSLTRTKESLWRRHDIHTRVCQALTLSRSSAWSIVPVQFIAFLVDKVVLPCELSAKQDSTPRARSTSAHGTLKTPRCQGAVISRISSGVGYESRCMYIFSDAYDQRRWVRSTLAHLGDGRAMRACVGGLPLAADCFVCLAGYGWICRLSLMAKVRFRLIILFVSASTSSAGCTTGRASIVPHIL